MSRSILYTSVAAACVALGCAASTRQEAARTLYAEQLHACVVNADTRGGAEACIAAIQNSWGDAGAPPPAASAAGSKVGAP